MKEYHLLIKVLIALIILAIMEGCSGNSKIKYDYSAYFNHMPRSILVLPPQNDTTEVMAPYIYLSTITRTLAEMGYYVYPVAVVDAMMKENGLSTPEEMFQVSLNKLQEVINPDAVLYMTIVQWGTKYQLIDSISIVEIRGRLIDTDSGTLLWEGSSSAVENSNRAVQSSSITELLVAAVIKQISSSFGDPTRQLAYRANKDLFCNIHKGLLVGHRHKYYYQNQRN
jgi:hypothetical protein